MSIEHIAKTCDSITTIAGRGFYKNPSNTIIWQTQDEAVIEKGEDHRGLENFARFLDGNPYDAHITLPLKFLQQLANMGKAQKRLVRSQHGTRYKEDLKHEERISRVDHWQISPREDGAVYCIPCDPKNNLLDFSAKIEGAWIEGNKDVWLSQELLRDVLREIPKVKANSSIRLEMKAYDDSPIAIVYQEGTQRIQANIGAMMPSDGIYHEIEYSYPNEEVSPVFTYPVDYPEIWREAYEEALAA